MPAASSQTGIGVTALERERVPARLDRDFGELVGAEPLSPHGRLARAQPALPGYPLGLHVLLGAEVRNAIPLAADGPPGFHGP
jgi:hypothetical protein